MKETIRNVPVIVLLLQSLLQRREEIVWQKCGHLRCCTYSLCCMHRRRRRQRSCVMAYVHAFAIVVLPDIISLAIV